MTTGQLVKWLKEYDKSGKRKVCAGFDSVQILGPLNFDRGRTIIAEIECRL